MTTQPLSCAQKVQTALRLVTRNEPMMHFFWETFWCDARGKGSVLGQTGNRRSQRTGNAVRLTAGLKEV